MWYLFIKTIITAVVVVLVAEIAKRSSFLGGLIISIPLTSFLALMWLYWDTKDNQKVIDLSNATFLMLIPSLAFFIFLPILIRFNCPFYVSMASSALLTAGCYWLYVTILSKLGYAGF